MASHDTQFFEAVFVLRVLNYVYLFSLQGRGSDLNWNSRNLVSFFSEIKKLYSELTLLNIKNTRSILIYEAHTKPKHNHST